MENPKGQVLLTGEGYETETQWGNYNLLWLYNHKS